MILGRWSFAFPLLLSTPLTVTLYYILTHVVKVHDNVLFPISAIMKDNYFEDVEKYPPVIVFACFLWFGELITMGYFLCAKTNVVLSRDSEMFLSPHYDGVFFEQHFILNRQRKKHQLMAVASGHERSDHNKKTIFVCSTMYRENETEMKQMLLSINRLACHHSQGGRDTYESHIFFDGALKDVQIKEFGLQLLSLLTETLNVQLDHGKREKTPYGYRLTWEIEGKGVSSKETIRNNKHKQRKRRMKFTVHFKDPDLVKAKKRWSQVMYMNYVINYRIKKDKHNMNADNTFILTTDADINFTPRSAEVLLDVLVSNPLAGAVCARTHPKGFGIIYWYQIFDYAIGHWFQKPAEHIFGCVLCSPGCFSVFRCSALETVLDDYSTEANGASEFLMKDMGEDRWLCTLLIKKGWRLEYCAISEDETYCPIEFAEFYKQRRRWIPSTIANLTQIITDIMSITRGNDSVSILFILFQAIMVFSTAISPATVILVISSGFQAAFHLSDTVTLTIIALLFAVSMLYGLVCIFGSSRSQIELAKILTFLFAILMSLVSVGIFKDTIYSFYNGSQSAVLQPSLCNTTDTSSMDYIACKQAARYVESEIKSLWRPNFVIPVSTSTIYLLMLVSTFLTAALLHPFEFYCLLHGVWHLLGLPSGYLLLLIYSAANLDSQSWGTREDIKGEEDRGLLGYLDKLSFWFKKCVVKCCFWCCGRKIVEEENKEQEEIEEKQSVTTEPPTHGEFLYSFIRKSTVSSLLN